MRGNKIADQQNTISIPYGQTGPVSAVFSGKLIFGEQALGRMYRVLHKFRGRTELPY
jgi:hypothetical protein